MNHLSAQDLTLLTELARCQIAANEAARAIADPRSEEAANFAATSERAAQDVLKRAIALGDRSLSIDPLRAVAARLGVTLNETTAEWRALAFEALRVLLDVAQERECREVGQYDAPTPVFRSVMLDANNVKTIESQRRLPVHPTLIDLGLLHLVEQRRRANSHRLFPHLTRGKNKGTFSENFSKNFTYYRKTNACYWEGLDLHAMRKSFNSDLMNRDKSDAIRCVLMGHDPVDEGTRSYAQGLSLSTLYERICDVELDVSMIDRPFGDVRNSAVARGAVQNLRVV